MPISVTSALAYPCEALTDDVDTPFRATDVAGKKMLKVRILEQRELLGNELPYPLATLQIPSAATRLAISPILQSLRGRR